MTKAWSEDNPYDETIVVAVTHEEKRFNVAGLMMTQTELLEYIEALREQEEASDNQTE